jgi:hypothetical protein
MKIDHQQVKREVTIFYILQGLGSLLEACEKAKLNYMPIYNQLNGRTELKLYSIKELVEKINEKFTAVEVDGKLVITRR